MENKEKRSDYNKLRKWAFNLGPNQIQLYYLIHLLKTLGVEQRDLKKGRYPTSNSNYILRRDTFCLG